MVKSHLSIGYLTVQWSSSRCSKEQPWLWAAPRAAAIREGTGHQCHQYAADLRRPRNPNAERSGAADDFGTFFGLIGVCVCVFSMS